MGLMASFERGMERFLVPVAIKLNSQKHVAAVRDGFVFTFPIIMASSLIILINFAILSPDGFIAGLLHLNSIFPNLEKAQAIFTPVMNGSVNIMSIMIAFLSPGIWRLAMSKMIFMRINGNRSIFYCLYAISDDRWASIPDDQISRRAGVVCCCYRCIDHQ